MNKVHSPVVSGSGVIVVHNCLQKHLEGYHVQALPPALGLFPMAAALTPAPATPVTHTLPELGPWSAHPDSQLVLTFHNYYLDRELLASAGFAQRCYYRTIMRHAFSRALPRAAVVTAVSTFTADLVRKDWDVANRLVVIRNGIDTGQFQPPADRRHEGVRILFVGNPIRRKGFSHLDALADTLPEGVSIHYTVGLRDSARPATGHSPRLVALPRRPHAEMPALYQEHDILFFPTLREGLSLAVAEAMACGLPVVATRCSSLPEQIVHGRGGFLFEPGNREQMRDYLTRLIVDPGLRQAMGAYNRDRALELFRLERMVEEYRQVFATLGVELGTRRN